MSIIVRGHHFGSSQRKRAYLHRAVATYVLLTWRRLHRGLCLLLGNHQTYAGKEKQEWLCLWTHPDHLEQKPTALLRLKPNIRSCTVQSVPRTSLHEVSKTIMHSHSAHLSWQCWQSSLLLSCRLAETDPLRGNIYQLAHSYLWQNPHLHLMELSFTTAVKNHPCCPTAVFPCLGLVQQWSSPRQLQAPVIGWKTH